MLLSIQWEEIHQHEDLQVGLLAQDLVEDGLDWVMGELTKKSTEVQPSFQE
jgi:hypothetical protein